MLFSGGRQTKKKSSGGRQTTTKTPHECRALRTFKAAPTFRGWTPESIEAFSRQQPRWTVSVIGAASTPDLHEFEAEYQGDTTLLYTLMQQYQEEPKVTVRLTQHGGATMDLKVTQLGEGATGTIFPGTYNTRPVAVKIDHSGHQSEVEFLTECLVQNELHCSNMVRGAARIPRLDAFCDNHNLRFVAMERLEQNLVDFPFSARQFQSMVIGVATLLRDLQRRFQFMHGDLKEDNIMHKRKHWYLIDFGNSSLQLAAGKRLTSTLAQEGYDMVRRWATEFRRKQEEERAHQPWGFPSDVREKNTVRADAGFNPSADLQFNPSADLRHLFFSFCMSGDSEHPVKRKLPPPRHGFQAPRSFSSVPEYEKHVLANLRVGMRVVNRADQEDGFYRRHQAESGRVVGLPTWSWLNLRWVGGIKVRWSHSGETSPQEPRNLLVVEDDIEDPPFPLHVKPNIPRKYRALVSKLVNRYTTGEVPGAVSWYNDAEAIPFTRVRAGANHVDMEFTPDAILKHFA